MKGRIARSSTWLPRALPRLGDRAFLVFRPLWVLAMIGAVIGATCGEIYTYQRITGTARAFAAFGLQIGVEVPVKLLFPLSPAAKSAGIARGDTILAIDGHPVATDARPEQIAPMLDAAGIAAIVRTRDANGRVADHLLHRDPSQANQTFAGTGLGAIGRQIAIRGWDSFIALVMFGAAVLLFVRRPRDPVAALLSIAFLLLLASYSWTWLLEIGHAHWLVAMLRPTAWTLMEVVLFTFPTGRFEPRWSATVALTLPAVWLYWVMFAPADAGAVVGVINMILLILALVSMRARFRTMATVIERQQIKWAMLGFTGGAVALLVALTASFVVPHATTNLHGLIWADTIASFALTTMVASFAMGLLVSLLRYRLYDADAIVSRSAGYALLTVMIGAIWAGGERGIERVVEAGLGHEAGASATVIAAALAAVLVAPAHSRVHKWAERRFQKALSHLRRGLPAFVEDMRETANVHELMEETLDRVEKGVRAVRGAVLLFGPTATLEVAAVRDVDPDSVAGWRDGWHPTHPHALDSDREDALFPLRLRLDGESGPIGWLLLGPRPDGSFYGRDERDALCEIAEPIARAVSVARRREARWDALHHALAAIGERLAMLEQAMIDAGALPVGASPAQRSL